MQRDAVNRYDRQARFAPLGDEGQRRLGNSRALVHREIAVHVALFSRDQRRDAASVSRPSTRMRQLRQVSQS